MHPFDVFLQHIRRVQEANKADPDDGNSWLCGACNLPIFSTPFKTISSSIHLHDQCAQLPPKLEDHALHPGYPLFLEETKDPATYCSNCSRQCGSMYYQCPNYLCDVLLDILCVREISIMHRSHKHRMVAMWRLWGAATLVCNACGTQHAGDDGGRDPSYLCKVCGFWIHPKCASLPNAVFLVSHPHSLFLNYHDSLADCHYKCEICGDKERGRGYLFCPKCSYHAHIRCAMSHPTVKPVLIRNVRNSELLRLPMPDEHTSLTRYILENSTSTSTDERQLQLQCVAEAGAWELHQHPLVFHNHHQVKEDGPHQCNACVQSISPPFYTCSKCPDFYLHNSCLNLPTEIKHHVAHKEHTLILHPESSSLGSHIGFRCHGCVRVCNGFVYCCKECEISLDVICALMPPAITHESHGKSHILYMSFTEPDTFFLCNCCDRLQSGIGYECSSCRDFQLDGKCALLPSSLTHKFDEHPLNLTTNTRPHQICEICEQEDMEENRWCYSCDKCDQSFHVDCIPCVDPHSRMKLGGRVSVPDHDCPYPLKLIRSSTVYGYRCCSCNNPFEPDGFENFAYECIKCYFRVHSKCVHRYTPANFSFSVTKQRLR